MSDGTIDQVCYTVHSPEAEWLAQNLPINVHAMWFGAFGIIRTVGQRVTSLSLNPAVIPGASAGTMGYDGIVVEIISLNHGPLVRQTLFFRDYVPRPEGGRPPYLERASLTALAWRNTDQACDLQHLATAIMALVDVFSVDDAGHQTSMTSVIARHAPDGAQAARSYRPPRPAGHVDSDLDEPYVVTDVTDPK